MMKKVLIFGGIGLFLIVCGIPMLAFTYGQVFRPGDNSLPTLVPTIDTQPPEPTSTPTPRPTSTRRPRPTSTPEPLIMEGRGGDIWNFETGGGVFIVSGWHVGDSNYIVKIYDAITGDLVGIPINCIGSCEDQSVERLYSGEYLIEVTADGAWQIYWYR